MPPPLRLVNRRIGQPRRFATAAILPSGFVGLVTVGVEVAVLEVNTVLRGELLHRRGLTRPPQNRIDNTAGEKPFLIGLKLVGERVDDAEEASHRSDLDGQRR